MLGMSSLALFFFTLPAECTCSQITLITYFFALFLPFVDPCLFFCGHSFSSYLSQGLDIAGCFSLSSLSPTLSFSLILYPHNLILSPRFDPPSLPLSRYKLLPLSSPSAFPPFFSSSREIHMLDAPRIGEAFSSHRLASPFLIPRLPISYFSKQRKRKISRKVNFTLQWFP